MKENEYIREDGSINFSKGLQIPLLKGNTLAIGFISAQTEKGIALAIGAAEVDKGIALGILSIVQETGFAIGGIALVNNGIAVGVTSHINTEGLAVGIIHSKVTTGAAIGGVSSYAKKGASIGTTAWTGEGFALGGFAHVDEGVSVSPLYAGAKNLETSKTIAPITTNTRRSAFSVLQNIWEKGINSIKERKFS